jgi:DNA repair exonuclease SbcCD ATPase subunit
MSDLQLISVSIENFASYRQRVTVDFSTEAGLRFVMGKNELEPRLDPNGAGKSSLFEAVLWCWYGKLSSGERASDVTNETGKRPDVTVKQLVDGAEYAIRRRGNPNSITVNGKEVEELTVEKLVGRSRDQTLQSVFFGQRAPLLLDLPVARRGELLEEVFQLQLWEEYSTIAKTKADDIQIKITKQNQEKAKLEGRKESIKQELVELKAAQTKWDAEKESRVTILLSEVEALEVKKLEIQKSISNVEVALSAPKTVNPERQILEIRAELERMQAHIVTHKSQFDRCTHLLEFYDSHSTCPTCFQPLSDSFVIEQISTLSEEKLAAVTANSHISNAVSSRRQDISRLEAEADKQRTERNTIEKTLLSLRGDLRNNENTILNLLEQADGIVNSDPYSAKVQQAHDRLSTTEAAVVSVQTETQQLEGIGRGFTYWKATFKLVKLFLMEQLVSQLSLEATSAAVTLGLVGWHISFTTEKETKSGTTKPGIQIEITPTDKNVKRLWSGGERQRIKLAVSLGFARVIQQRARHRIKLLILDEPTQFLSTIGVEDLVHELSYYAKANNICVWLIDHRSLGFGGFAETIRVVKDENGSRVEKV